MSVLRVHNQAWVLVGDGKKALLLTNEGDADLLNLRRVLVEDHHRVDSGNPNPNKHSPESTVPAAHGETRGNWREFTEHGFAVELARSLNEGARTQQFREVIIVAPPKVLGEIRRELSSETQKRVVAEIDKDYTHHTLPEIEKLLARHEMG